MEFHAWDEKILRQFNGDMKNTDLIAEYEIKRNCWNKGGEVGQLPRDVLFVLATNYQQQEKQVELEETLDVEELEAEPLDVVEKVVPMKKAPPKKKVKRKVVKQFEPQEVELEAI